MVQRKNKSDPHRVLCLHSWTALISSERVYRRAGTVKRSQRRLTSKLTGVDERMLSRKRFLALERLRRPPRYPAWSCRIARRGCPHGIHDGALMTSRGDQAGCGRRPTRGSGRGCKSSSCSRLYGPGVPGRSDVEPHRRSSMTAWAIDGPLIRGGRRAPRGFPRPHRATFSRSTVSMCWSAKTLSAAFGSPIETK